MEAAAEVEVDVPGAERQGSKSFDALRSGDHFGEAALTLKREVMGFQASATGRCLVMTIPQPTLTWLFELLPELHETILVDTKRQLLEAFRVEGLPFFNDLPDEGLKMAAMHSALRVSPPTKPAAAPARHQRAPRVHTI